MCNASSCNLPFLRIHFLYFNHYKKWAPAGDPAQGPAFHKLGPGLPPVITMMYLVPIIDDDVAKHSAVASLRSDWRCRVT